MKVFEVREKFGLANLKVADRPMPALGPGRVLIKMRACSVNYRDWLMVTGRYNPKQPLPLIPLSDGVGEVVDVGRGVTRVKTGDRVAGIFAQKWLHGDFTPEARSSTLGGPLDGMLAEYAALHQSGVVKIPDYLADEEAATLPCAAVTAWNALTAHGQLRPGDSVLLLGTGGVSVFGLQFARMAGARVIITSSSDEKLKNATQLGASHGINYLTDPNWDKKVRELTDGKGVDYVLEVGGAETLQKSINAIRFGGLIALIGILSGIVPEIALTSILMKEARIHGVFVGHRTMFEDMVRAMELNEFKPVVDHVFPVEEAVEAFSYLEERKHFGKIVIRF